MKYELLEGKNLDDLKKEALEKLNCTENDVIFLSNNIKKNLFKSDVIQLKIYRVSDIADYIKSFLIEVLKNMNINVNSYEIKVKEKQIYITFHSDKDNILIGRDGKNLKALENYAKQFVYNKIKIYPYLILNASNYKEKQESYLIKLAKKIAYEVRSTKHDVIMDNMNSYERRIIHNALSDIKGITTISEGIEPNRHIIVKPNDEK